MQCHADLPTVWTRMAKGDKVAIVSPQSPKLNPLDYPACLSYPLRLASTAWAAHVPFAMFLVDIMRPRRIVELGTFTGVSYCAFCQAVKELKLSTRCFAIDTWEGDEQSGLYDGATVLKDLKAHHDPLYEGFSSLIQSTFDEALNHFEDRTIDLLHIDGYHTYESVSHDFQSWLPKMSTRGVMLFHDINVRERDFGVWKLWGEIKHRYPHFEFMHEHGLGVLAVGVESQAGFRDFFEASEYDALLIREFFHQLGERLRVRIEKDHDIEVISWQVQDEEHQIKTLSAELDVRAERIASLSAELETRAQETEAQQQTIYALTAELTAREARLSAVLNSNAWRWANRGSRVKRRYLMPLYDWFRHTSGNGLVARTLDHKHTQSNREARSLSVPKLKTLDDPYQSVTLLSATEPKQLSAVASRLPSPTLLPRVDVICFSIIDWDFRYQRPQQVMSQFAEFGHRVFYIRCSQTLPLNESERFSLNKLKENLYEVTLAAERPPRINQEDINGPNAATLLDSLDVLRRACCIDNAIAYVMTPSWTSLVLEAKKRWGWHLLYDCMDEWNNFPGMAQAVVKVEERLVKQSDLVVVTGRRLFDKWLEFQRPMVLAQNAVDYDFYAAHCRPNPLLPDVQHPVVGYYGAIADWFDLELMIHVARARSNYTFVLLGGIFDVDVSELERLPNVRVLGQQPYATMPQYLYHFDACLIPFRVNEITHATDPVKMYEYLSAGKPVVAAFLEELQPLQEYLYLARDKEEFLLQLDRALAESDPDLVARRRAFTAENTWKKRYDTITAGLRDATPRASIIVVTYNNLALTRLCLESVVCNTDYPNYEVIVVDNNSSDGTPAYLRYLANEYSNIQVVLNPENAGFARANNQGIARSTGDYFVLLNNDTIVPSGWLSRLLRHLQDPTIGLVGPVTNFAGNEAKIDVPYRTWSEMEDFAREYVWMYEGQTAEIKVLAMFCVALRRNTYEQIGPLDEQFGIGMFEDDDYSLRINAAGLRVVCAADVFVHHFGQASFKKLIPTGVYDELFTENRRRFETKWNITWIPHQNARLQFEPIGGESGRPS
jgi:GT2 family glycosyltransferase/glycosyltransferase involved in cell wall biosynthesis